ncbi:helix-turn-helix domain-containing protein [Azospirillum thermophilum]|uniref:Crp/Fnr family transcriptional regulator n=1 Tax=Azospirillum thermophilum TaxID=2202148 RepID=A0A2S2CUY2_9PROT|nr:helix-turn-helix domain-containing protein [Azospirillum thermophilum]AWK88180.1 Crp/Fnr family transcriptional regulator [Azospirillum thermophilum]
MAAQLTTLTRTAQPFRGFIAASAARELSPAGTTLGARPVESDPLATVGTLRCVERDMAVFSEGDDADSVYRVVDGMIRLHKLLPDGRRQVVGFLQAGDMLGLSVGGLYIYTAEAVTTSSLRRIPRERLDSLMDEQPALARKLLTTMTTELVAAQDQMLLLGRKTAAEKLASFLIALGKRAAARTPGCRRVELPMSRTDIADYLGLTTETVSRGFTKLKTARLIRLLEGNRVELVDQDALADMAGCCCG